MIYSMVPRSFNRSVCKLFPCSSMFAQGTPWARHISVPQVFTVPTLVFNVFFSLVLLEPVEDGRIERAPGDDIDYAPVREARIYSQGRSQIWQRQVQDYWKGDWPTCFGGVASIIGAYDAINANTANLGISSIRCSVRRSGRHGWI